jgi:hypothetical protein
VRHTADAQQDSNGANLAKQSYEVGPWHVVGSSHESRPSHLALQRTPALFTTCWDVSLLLVLPQESSSGSPFLRASVNTRLRRWGAKGEGGAPRVRPGGLVIGFRRDVRYARMGS